MHSTSIRPFLLVVGLSAMVTRVAGAGDVPVANSAALRRAIAEAQPGTNIRIEPGTYEGGIFARGLRGRADSPIRIGAADPNRPPVIRGGSSGLHLSDPAHVELHDLVVIEASDNGINIDDGGSFDTPAHHVVLLNLIVRDVGPKGNHDGIKLSGLDDFRVGGCTIERWGERGSAIDMVGCHRGEIVGSTFRHADQQGDSGVQAKGGSAEIGVRRCRFEHAGQRGVNIGGSTGLAYFRPGPQGYEARDITVEDCIFVGSMSPVAFVGVDGATVRHNTIYRPLRWVIRILRETSGEGFVPCRRGHFTDNLIVFRSDEMAVPVNVGPGTAPETFTLARNAWYCVDDPQRSRLNLPIPESEVFLGSIPGSGTPTRATFGPHPKRIPSQRESGRRASHPRGTAGEHHVSHSVPRSIPIHSATIATTPSRTDSSRTVSFLDKIGFRSTGKRPNAGLPGLASSWNAGSHQCTARGEVEASGIAPDASYWVVERMISWLKGLCRMRVRYDRLGVIRDAWTTLAVGVICFRILHHDVM